MIKIQALLLILASMAKFQVHGQSTGIAAPTSGTTSNGNLVLQFTLTGGTFDGTNSLETTYFDLDCESALPGTTTNLDLDAAAGSGTTATVTNSVLDVITADARSTTTSDSATYCVEVKLCGTDCTDLLAVARTAVTFNYVVEAGEITIDGVIDAIPANNGAATIADTYDTAAALVASASDCTTNSFTTTPSSIDDAIVGTEYFICVYITEASDAVATSLTGITAYTFTTSEGTDTSSSVTGESCESTGADTCTVAVTFTNNLTGGNAGEPKQVITTATVTALLTVDGSRLRRSLSTFAAGTTGEVKDSFQMILDEERNETTPTSAGGIVGFLQNIFGGFFGFFMNIFSIFG